MTIGALVPTDSRGASQKRSTTMLTTRQHTDHTYRGTHQTRDASRKLMWRLLSWERIWEQNIVKTMRTSGTWWNRLDGSTSVDLQL